MVPVITNTTNVILVAPEGQEGSVGKLPSTRYVLHTPDGDMPSICSCWELSDEEIEKLKETKRIYFHTYGETHPPIMLTVDKLEEIINVIEE